MVGTQYGHVSNSCGTDSPLLSSRPQMGNRPSVSSEINSRGGLGSRSHPGKPAHWKALRRVLDEMCRVPFVLKFEIGGGVSGIVILYSSGDSTPGVLFGSRAL